MCGTCCRGLNEGEVFLFKTDIERLAKHLGFTGTRKLKEFCRKYLKIVEDTFFWKNPKTKRGKRYKFSSLGFKFEGEDEHCVFLGKNNQCTIHEARPFQCRAFPIGWNVLLNNLKYIKDYANRCPALKGTLNNEGKFYPREQVIQWAQKEYEIEKNYFLEMKKNNFDIFKVYKFLPRDITC